MQLFAAGAIQVTAIYTYILAVRRQRISSHKCDNLLWNSCIQTSRTSGMCLANATANCGAAETTRGITTMGDEEIASIVRV